MTGQDRILPGVALMIAFCVTAPLIDVAAKIAAQVVPVGTVTLGRFVVQAGLMLPVVLAMGLSLRLTRRAASLTFWRALTSILATYCFVAAVRVMPIADALAIVFVEPFIILLIGKLVLAEQVGPRRLAAAAFGFAGSLLVIQPSFVTFGAVALFPLATALFFALYMLITRRLSREMHPVTMQFHTALFAGVLLFPALLVGGAFGSWQVSFMAPEGIFWLWVFCVGLAATISHMAITYALAFAPSATLAPLHYLEIVTATLFGFLFFGDFPNSLTWAGIAIIVASGLYVIHRERVQARADRPAYPANMPPPPV